MTQITRDTSRGQLVPFVFGQDAVAASQTDVQLPAMSAEEGGTVDGYTIPFDYDVIAVSATLSAAGSAGTLAVGATVGGAELAASTLTVTTQTDASKRIPRNSARGNAGTRLGCELTTDSNWDGTTADLLVTIYCIVYLDGV